MDTQDAQRRKSAVAWLSVVSNTVLVGFKLAVGLLIGSVSVLSEAIHSGVDLLAAVIALFAVKTSSKPADPEHPYGHGKIENISGTVEALLIFVAGVWIIYEAVHKLVAHEGPETVGLGVAVMAVSAVANYVVSSMLFKVGRETDSVALQADGWHLRTDVWTSAGVMAGLATIAVAGRFLPGVDLWWLDPVVAIAVALLIIKAAWDLTAHSLRDMLDARLPDDEEEWIRSQARQRGWVRGFHGLRTRKSGPKRFVDYHVLVERNMTIEDAHRLSDELTGDILARFPGASVTAHIEPCDGSCKPKCEAGCHLPDGDRARMKGSTPASGGGSAATG